MMTARADEKARDDASHKEAIARERTVTTARDQTQQGVVKDERGQEQPSDKKRARKIADVPRQRNERDTTVEQKFFAARSNSIRNTNPGVISHAL